MQQYKRKNFYKLVTWICPIKGWIKINIDGAYRGNPGLGSYEFCMRDCSGDVIYS